MQSPYFRWLILGIFGFLANCAPKPTAKEMVGKVTGKARLQLADGSMISRDDSDEYNPYLVQLSDGYLVLVFGSDRNGGVHNIFVTKSVEPYNGFEIPAFETPTVVTAASSPIDDANMINFAATASGTSVVLYVNLHTASGFIRKGVVPDTLAPDVGSFASITNTNQESNTIIGINANGSDLITLDYNGIAYLVNPDNSTTSNPFGANLDYSVSATQVRYDNSGQNDAYMGTYYGSTFATTGTEYYGPIFDFDFSLADSGLSIGQMTTFYDGYSAYGDMVLFAAHDGISADIYVVTSHTAGMLWQLAAPIIFDAFLPPAPMPDHWYDFESYTCPTGPVDSGVLIGGWDPTSCNVVTSTAGSYDGSNYGLFSNASSSVLDLGASPRNLGSAFTISAWVWVNAAPACSNTCLIVANSAIATNTNGFRLFVDSSDFSVHFVTGDGVSSETDVATYPGYMAAGEWHHIVVTVNTLSTFALVYIDGAVANSGMPFTVPGGFNSNQVITFGRTGGTQSLDGRMDNIKIYERELDPMEVLALFLE